MSIENITFENIDTPKETAVKTVQIYAGSTELKKHLTRLNISYVRVNRGIKVVYILRNKSFGKVEVTL